MASGRVIPDEPVEPVDTPTVVAAGQLLPVIWVELITW